MLSCSFKNEFLLQPKVSKQQLNLRPAGLGASRKLFVVSISNALSTEAFDFSGQMTRRSSSDGCHGGVVSGESAAAMLSSASLLGDGGVSGPFLYR